MPESIKIKVCTNLKKAGFSAALAILAALFIISVFAACSSSGEKVFSEKDNGKTVTLKAGNSFSVKLESNQTTGYSWKLSEKTNSEIVSFLSSEYKASEKDKDMVGTGGFENFNFKAKSKGKTEIILEYVRPWEENVEPVSTFILSVKVN